MNPELAWLDDELARVAPHVRAPLRAPLLEPSDVVIRVPYNASSQWVNRTIANATGNIGYAGYQGPTLTDADVRRIERGEQ